MANTIGKIEFNIKKGSFDKLDKLLSNIIDYADEFEEEVEYNAGIDAANFAEQLATNYQSYVQSYTRDKELNPDLPGYERIQFTSGRTYGTPTIITKYGKDGFEVIIRGRDIQYQEYGTGDIGAEDPHPEKPADWIYSSGANVIRNGKYINGGSVNDVIPKWYKSGVEKGSIDENRAIWMAPFGPTYGLPSGQFVYNTFDEYIHSDDIYGSGYLGSEMSQSPYKLNQRNFVTRAKAKITEGLK